MLSQLFFRLQIGAAVLCGFVTHQTNAKALSYLLINDSESDTVWSGSGGMWGVRDRWSGEEE